MKTTFAAHAAVLLSLAFALGGCCKGSHLDDTKIEASIKAELASKGVQMKSIDCPPDRPMKQGDQFTCSGIDQDNDALVFRVEQTDAKGTISWKMDGIIIDQAKIGDSIEAKIGKSTDVQCSAKTLIMKVGSSWSCPVDIAGKKQHVMLTVADDKGNVNWKLTP